VSGATLRRLETDLGELVARHERGRDLSEFERWASDPIGFIREVLGETDPGPWGRQVAVAEALRDSPLVAVRGCNASGKDWLAARLALWWTYARRGLVLVTGPTERQVREVVMGELGRAFRRTPDLPGELFASALRLAGSETAGVLAFTSTEASRLTGFHAPRVLALLTEAQAVEPFAWEGVLACATGSEDRVLAVGNPLAPAGTFHAVSRDGSGWDAMRIAGSDVPNVREGRVVVPGLLTREGIQRIRAMYGERSAIYRRVSKASSRTTPKRDCSPGPISTRRPIGSSGRSWREPRAGAVSTLLSTWPGWGRTRAYWAFGKGRSCASSSSGRVGRTPPCWWSGSVRRSRSGGWTGRGCPRWW